MPGTWGPEPAVYLDNAATSYPKPESVHQAMDRFLREAGANPGRSAHRMAVAAASAVAQTRLLVARFFNAPSPEQVAFTLNTTDALNLALKGILKPGDNVITISMEHNSVVRPLRKLEKDGVGITVVGASTEGLVSVEGLAAAFTPATRLVAVTHASNVTGTLQPITEIGRLCRVRGVRLLVDAAQTAGVFPIDVREMGIDLLAFPGHKSLLGPPGTGGLIVGEGISLVTLREGGTGSQSESEEQPESMPDRLESGTLNTVGIAGLGAGLRFIEETRRERIREHEQVLVQRLLRGLAEIHGVTIYGRPPGAERASAVSFNLAGWEPQDAAAVLDATFDLQCRAGLHCAPLAHRTIGSFPAGTVRFSPGFFNTEEEIDAALEAVKELAAGSGAG
jgi:cysteine desulfurase / selenocysteine lyase